MRPELGVAVALAIVTAGSRADADDIHTLLAADTYLATEPGYTTDDAADIA